LATCSNSALQLIKFIYVEKQSMAPDMARLRTTPKSYGSVNSERDHSSSPHQVFAVLQGGAFVISGLPGDGAFVADLFKYSEFHIFSAKFSAYVISFQEEGIVYSSQKRD